MDYDQIVCREKCGWKEILVHHPECKNKKTCMDCERLKKENQCLSLLLQQKEEQYKALVQEYNSLDR